MAVLDLGCGDGITAVPDAKLSANVYSGSTLRAISSPPAMRARHKPFFPVCGSMKAMGGRSDDLRNELVGLFEIQHQGGPNETGSLAQVPFFLLTGPAARLAVEAGLYPV
jgi:hypothetical protein